MTAMLVNFFKVGIWQVREQKLPLFKVIYIKALKVIILSVQGFFRRSFHGLRFSHCIRVIE